MIPILIVVMLCLVTGRTVYDVATGLTRDQLLQGGGEMPAYAKNLSSAEVTPLVAFLATPPPPGHPPARDSSAPTAP